MDRAAQVSALSLSLPRTAVFIDGDWLVHATRAVGGFVDFGRLSEALRRWFGEPTRALIYVSLRPEDRRQAEFCTSLQQYGYEVVTFTLERRGAQLVSKGLDVQLAMDAMALSAEFDRLVLVSGDGDFIPLLRSAKKRGRSTVLVALPFVASRALAEAADHFATVEDLIEIPSANLRLEPASSTMPPASSDSYVEKGQHLEPYLLIRGIMTGAERVVTIIDPYIDEQVLLLVPLLNPAVAVVIVTEKISPPDFCNMVQKLRREGHQIAVYKTNQFHDRYIQADDAWWHSGHSLKDLGTKDSRLSAVNDQVFITKLKLRLENAIRGAEVVCPEPSGQA